MISRNYAIFTENFFEVANFSILTFPTAFKSFSIFFIILFVAASQDISTFLSSAFIESPLLALYFRISATIAKRTFPVLILSLSSNPSLASGQPQRWMDFAHFDVLKKV